MRARSATHPPHPQLLPPPLHRWTEYADRKADEDDDNEHVANSLLYDRNHLPRMAPAPDCVLPPPEAPAPRVGAAAATQQQQQQAGAAVGGAQP